MEGWEGNGEGGNGGVEGMEGWGERRDGGNGGGGNEGVGGGRMGGNGGVGVNGRNGGGMELKWRGGGNEGGGGISPCKSAHTRFPSRTQKVTTSIIPPRYFM